MMYPKILKLLRVNVAITGLDRSPSAGTAAARPRQPIGERINVFAGVPTAFPVGAAFHIRHGHGRTPSADAIGAYDFKLQVDGADVPEDYLDTSTMRGEPDGTLRGEPDELTKIWVFNFPNGMTGTHTFVGHCLGPCDIMSGSCSRPNAQVELFATTLTVTFGPKAG